MDKHFLTLALEQAVKGIGNCAPNPAVGAVIVKAGQIIATGYHRGVGTDHAEVDAIKQADDVKGATIYVTLEPCCHTGRTPPCTKAIIEAGISRVVFACRDPNRHTAETGEQVLKRAGIDCEFLPIPQIEEFYRYYFHWLKTKTPWLTAKLAVSFDGKIAGPLGKPVKITGNKLDVLTHQKRLQADGILTTVKTIIADDPQLNARVYSNVPSLRAPAKQSRRTARFSWIASLALAMTVADALKRYSEFLSGLSIREAEIKKPLFILDSHCDLPLTARIFKTAKSITVFHKENAEPERIKILTEHDVICIPTSWGRDDGNGLDLTAVKNYLGKIGLHQVWIEAGGIATSSFLQAGLLDEFLLYIAPVLLGSKAVRAFSELMDFERAVKEFKVMT